MALGKHSRQEHADRCVRPVSSAAQPASTLHTLDNSRTSLELRAYLLGGFLRPLSSPRRQKPHSLRCSRLVPASTPESVWVPASVNIQIPPTPPAPVQNPSFQGVWVRRHGGGGSLKAGRDGGHIMCVLQLQQHLAGSPAGPPSSGHTISTGSHPLADQLSTCSVLPCEHLKSARRNQEPKVQIWWPQRLL